MQGLRALNAYAGILIGEHAHGRAHQPLRHPVRTGVGSCILLAVDNDRQLDVAALIGHNVNCRHAHSPLDRRNEHLGVYLLAWPRRNDDAVFGRIAQIRSDLIAHAVLEGDAERAGFFDSVGLHLVIGLGGASIRGVDLGFQ